MRKITRALVAIVMAGAIGGSLTGCLGAAEKTVDYTETSVSLAPGEALVVDLGEVNSSIGTDWVIVQEPDSAVLGAGEAEYQTDGEAAPGSPSELSYRFAPVGAGVTVIEFEYQFRGSVPDDAAERKTAEITVTVK